MVLSVVSVVLVLSSGVLLRIIWCLLLVLVRNIGLCIGVSGLF